MVFNSLPFLIFLPVVLLLYYRLEFRAQNVLLVIASYFFYGWWNWRFVGLLLFTTLLDYFCAMWIEAEAVPSRRKYVLALSIGSNMVALGFFKYYNFFADSLAHVFAAFGWNADMPTLHVVLPVGISFYTFLSMSYTIDVYRREIKASRNPIEFMLYVSFFPHLVAGPIVRAAFLLPQCRARRTIVQDEVLNGIWLCLLGYTKKVVIADRLAQIVEWGFGGSSLPYTDLNAWLIVYAFAFQIYGDFSGYSDIARGLSKLMGFELVVNFRKPYLVSNPAAFWRHWHISLSVWLRDYLYIPLGGNRLGSLRTYGNLMVTMLLGGLWHGAGIAYLLWGLYHGLLLSLNRAIDSLRGISTKAAESHGHARPFFERALFALGFFQITCLGWLLFRVGALGRQRSQWEILLAYVKAMFCFHLNQISPLVWPVSLLGGLAVFMQWKCDWFEYFARWDRRLQAIGVAAALFLITALGVFQGSSFIYFQF